MKIISKFSTTAPIEEVFSMLSSEEKSKAIWPSSSYKNIVGDAAQITKGTQYEYYYKVREKYYTSHVEILEVVQDQLIRQKSSNEFSDSEITYKFLKIATGTEVTLEANFRLKSLYYRIFSFYYANGIERNFLRTLLDYEKYFDNSQMTTTAQAKAYIFNVPALYIKLGLVALYFVLYKAFSLVPKVDDSSCEPSTIESETVSAGFEVE